MRWRAKIKITKKTITGDTERHWEQIQKLTTNRQAQEVNIITETIKPKQ